PHAGYCGVISLALVGERIDDAGENAGFYERATGAEVRGHFAEAAGRLEATGRGRVLAADEHLGDGRVRDLRSGEVHEVTVRRKLVDARYLEASVPATHTPGFEVAAGARVVPGNDLPSAA